MTPAKWPAWRWSADGKSAIFETEADVPEGWMTRDEYLALEPSQDAEADPGEREASVETDDAEKAATERLRAALLTCGDDVLEVIADEPTALDAAAAAIDLLVEKLAAAKALLDADRTESEGGHEQGEVPGDLNGDGVVEPNREEIKKALTGLKVEFDGRLATDKLQAILTEAQAKAGA